MSDVKLAVVYYSTYGTNHKLAETAAEAAREAGAEVRLRKVRETAPREVVEAQEAWAAQAKSTEQRASVSAGQRLQGDKEKRTECPWCRGPSARTARPPPRVRPGRSHRRGRRRAPRRRCGVRRPGRRP